MKKSLVHILALAAMLLSVAAYGQFPSGVNKQRLGFQTTGDGLVWRGSLADTTSIKPAGLNNAYFILDTVNAVLYRYIKTQGGWQAVGGAEGDLLHVLEAGDNSAAISLDAVVSEGSTVIIVDANNATPWDGINIVGIVSESAGSQVVFQGAGLITITETAQPAGGTITIGATIPQNYITSDLLSAGVRDSLSTEVTLEQGGQISATIVVDNNTATPWDGLYVIGITETIGTEGEVVLTIDGQTVTFQIGSNLSFPDTTGVITLENNQGTDVYFAPGENVALSSSDDTLTISAPLSLSVSQGSLGPAFLVVDGNNALPWDGINVIGYFTTATIGVTLQLNNESVTFYPVQDGDKSDITVTGNGETWTIDNGVVDWVNLGDVQDSIEARLKNPVDSILFKTTYESTAQTGELIWNSQSGTLHLGMAGGIEMPVGQGEAHMVRNVTGSAIPKGKVVYISGATGQRPQVSLANAKGEVGSSVTFGVTAEEIGNNDTGFVFTSGYIKGINTNGLTEGAALWLDTIPGGFSTTKYYAPNHSVLVGYVVTAKNNGEIFVKIQNGQELDELHNVNVQGVTDRGSLYYHAAQGIWRDTSAALVGTDTVSLSNRINGKLDSLAGEVTTFTIRDTAVTTAKIATGAVTGAKLGSMTSAQLAGALSDETGTGVAVFGTAPTLTNSVTINNTTAGGTTGSVILQAEGATQWSLTTLTTLPARNFVIYNANEPFDRPFSISRINSRVGIGTDDPQRKLHVLGEARISDLITDTPLQLLGADGDGDIGSVGSTSKFITSGYLADSAVTSVKIGTAAVNEANLASNSVGTAKLIDGAASGAKLGTMYYLRINDADVSLDASPTFYLSTYSQLVVWIRIGSTASRKAVFPTPSATYDGKVVELFFGATNGATHYGYIESGGTNRITYRDGANVATASSYDGGQVLTYAKVMCMLDPSSGVYQWVVTNYNKY